VAIRFRSDVEKGLNRVPITVTKEMEEWLHRLSLQMKASGGNKLPKSYIIRSLLNAVMKLKIDTKGIKTEKELTQNITEAMKKFK